MTAPLLSQPSPIARAGLPRWIAFSLLTILCWGTWGAVSKVASAGVDAYSNQIFFTIGLLPLIAYAARYRGGGAVSRQGVGWAFLTGLLGGTGNMAFFHALAVGGQASVVVPVTALFPLVTVILALSFLRERLGKAQIAGLILALLAIYLLSME